MLALSPILSDAQPPSCPCLSLSLRSLAAPFPPQHHFLQDIFRHAVGLGRAAAAAQDGATCAASLSLMAAVLGWDFRRSSSLAPLPAMPLSLPASRVGSGAGGSGGSVSGTAPSAGADWAALLLAPETLDWVAALLGQLAAAGGSGGGGGAAAQELVARARGVVVALCNISADVFPREGGLRGGGGGERNFKTSDRWTRAANHRAAQAPAGSALILITLARLLPPRASPSPRGADRARRRRARRLPARRAALRGGVGGGAAGGGGGGAGGGRAAAVGGMQVGGRAVDGVILWLFGLEGALTSRTRGVRLRR